MADPLSDGDPAVDQDHWFRVLTNTGHTTADGRVHHSALSPSQFSGSRRPQRWDHEISGRLMSLAGSADAIRAEGEARAERARQSLIAKGKNVPSKISFHGIAYGIVAPLRDAITERIASDVIYTPEHPDDNAHADLVTRGSVDTDHETVRDFVLKGLRHAGPGQLGDVITKCAADLEAGNAQQPVPAPPAPGNP